MKIAFIIQCHKNAIQLNRLINELSDDDVDVYLHIDSKSKNLEQQIDLRDGLYILEAEKRVDVKWGQISQVDATLQLVDSVLSTNRIYDYVWLISGQDFPIKPIEQIKKFLSNSNEYAYIDVMDTSMRRYRRFLKRNEVFTAQWSIKKGIFYRIIRNIWYLLTGGRYHTFKLFRRQLGNDTFFFGSSWWCLPYNAVKQMRMYLDSNPQFYKFFRHCHCPDESFFQTLLINHTTYANHVKALPVYINWGADKNSPMDFSLCDKDELDNLIKSEEYLFARKFDDTVDPLVIPYIISRLEHGNEED